MTPPPSFFHSLLRPAVLQILRATGYHGAKAAVLDALTDLAVRYLSLLCERTAAHAAENAPEAAPLGAGGAAPTLVDVRLALQDVDAFGADQAVAEQTAWAAFAAAAAVAAGNEEEDVRGVDDFVAWATGPVCREIRRIALDGNDEASDYLIALKKKHSKADDDSKYNGTLLGKSNEHGDVLVEGGELPSILTWNAKMRDAASMPMPEDHIGDETQNADSRPSSSGLSSLGDRTIADDMDLS